MKSAIIKMGFSICIVAVGIWIGSTLTPVNADSVTSSSQPGSTSDPVVTKSYVDQSVETIVKNELSKMSVNEAQIRGIVEDEMSKGGSASGIVVVALDPGQTLIAKAGAEIIVRNGKAIAYSTDGNGIPDTTAGKDIANGEVVGNNHLLIFPRDGRGIKPDASVKGTMYIMVRGGYTVMDKDGKEVQS